MAYDLTAIDASTHNKIQKKWQDNLSTKTPMFLKAKSSKGLAVVDGGYHLDFPVIAKKGVAKSYYGDDVFDTTRPVGLIKLRYDWKQFYSQVRIDGIEEIMNSGPEAAADLLDGRFTQAETTTAENFEDMLMGDGTGNVGSDGTARDWTGIQQLISDTPTTGNIGGQSRATYDNLRNQLYSTAVTAFNTNAAGRIGMTTLWAACSHGTRTPNFGVTTETIWVLYQISLTTNERYMMNGDKEMASAGFPNVLFMNFPIVISRACLASHMYFVRFAKPKSDGGIFLIMHKDRNFKLGKFREPLDGDYRVAYSLSAGEFATDAPYLNGVASNITG